MTYEEFVSEEKAIEVNHPDFFTGGKKLGDYILIVFNLRTGYKRHEWINEKGLSPEVKNDVTEFLARLEESKGQA
jgi:hypothetical protein